MPPAAGSQAPHAAREQAEDAPRPLVLIVNPAGLRERGGMGRMVRYLVEAWRDRGGAPRVEVLDSRGSGSVLFAPFFLARALAVILLRCTTDKVALLHVNMAENTSVLRKGAVIFAAKLLKVPVLLHLHAGLFADFYRKLPLPARLFTRWVFRAADRTIVLGEVWRRMLSEELGIDPRRIAVVYNGVPEAPSRAQMTSDEPCRILYVGKLRPEKGLSELMQALSGARLKSARWTLCLVGDGERGRFERIAAAHGLSDRVRFTGWLEPDAVREQLASADVFVLPSHYEGLPLGLLEALSAGLAIVTTRVGALPEILRDGESALLVPPGDAGALEEALLRVTTDKGLLSRLAAASRALYETKFTIGHFSAAIERQYALAILSHKSGAFA
jgi:glycosyltransferase involved in cell wall biosynthesis